jgi:6-phosphogluconolactonase (cycloisomerase 2 family)
MSLDGCCSRSRACSFFLCLSVLIFISLQVACGGATSNTGSNGGASGGGSGSGGSGSGSGGSGGSGSGGSGGSGGGGSDSAVAYVYVGAPNLSSAGAPIEGFAVASDGTAQTIAGSPFNVASDSVVASSSYAFATDGTNIVSHSIGSGGTLQQVSTIDGTANNQIPNGSAVQALSLDRTGATLYAAELNYDGTGNNAFSSFGIGSSGGLTFLNSSSEDANDHGPLAFSQGNQYAYGEGCYHFNSEIYGFSRSGDGTITSVNTNAQLPPNIDPNTLWCPDDSAASAGNFLAVVFYDLSQQNGTYYLATYTINSDGTLALVANSEIATPFTGETAMSFDPSGQYLAVAGGAGIQVYQISAAGLLTAVGDVQQPSLAFLALRWDGAGHLYAVTSEGLYIFSSNNGQLTLDGSPYPVTNAGSLAVVPLS